MNVEASDFWSRALQATRTAENLLPMDSDAAASRAYYGAYFAVSALFALEGKTFTKHSGVEEAVHRDLVKEGRWHVDLGADYRFLRRVRTTGDYGEELHVSSEDASRAVDAAYRILQAVHRAYPVAFPAVWEAE